MRQSSAVLVELVCALKGKPKQLVWEQNDGYIQSRALVLSSMGFGGAGVFVEAHLVAVCCKRVPRRARRGAERALWDMVGARVAGKRAADTPFFGNHPESSRSNKQPNEWRRCPQCHMP